VGWICLWSADHIGDIPWPISMIHMFWYQFR